MHNLFGNPKFLAALTIVNLFLLIFLSVRIVRPVEAASPDVAPVLRGRALEIVDAQGRVRASISILPAEPAKKYPETVILRLITPNLKPTVKLATSEEGSALGILGDSDATNAVFEANGATTDLRLTNRDGKQQVLKP